MSLEQQALILSLAKGGWKIEAVAVARSFIAQALEWATEYSSQPYYPPGHGSIRLETRFGVRRTIN